MEMEPKASARSDLEEDAEVRVFLSSSQKLQRVSFVLQSRNAAPEE